MKATFFTIILFALSNSLFAQENRDTSTMQTFPCIEVEAEFPGGSAALVKYITQNIIFAEKYNDTDVPSKIYVSFFVEPDGSITDVKMENGKGNKREMG